MLRIYTYPSNSAEKKMASIENRSYGYAKKDVAAVNRIIADVKKNGDDALVKYTNRFDSKAVGKSSLHVSKQEQESALKKVDAASLRSLRRAAKQIKEFHQKQLQHSWISTNRAGTVLGQLVNPVAAAGIYVPGGKAGRTPLVSSVLMCAIPAAIAGVKKITMVTPPMKSGAVSPYLLAAAKIAGVHDVYKIGSAWGIAAMAYGTETVPRSDVIAGPGNIYVTIAKKIVSGDVGIDMLAGPSEILVIADDSAVPEYIAADLLSQAEHDVLASAVLVTTSKKIVEAVRKMMSRQIERLERKEIAGTALRKYGTLMVVPDVSTAIKIANRIAPEHLELQIRDPFSYIGQIHHAGAVFVGNYTPEPVGDYMAGPNHVLPTAGTAKYASALSVNHFLKRTSIIHYSKAAFKKEAKDIIRIAAIEGLDAHANSIKVRIEKKHR